MPRGRPPKRLGEDDAAESPSDGPKLKLPRLVPEDFSSVVKNKLQSYTRTGQACDRCKVRKIRCDALPEGCSHCLSQSLECYVTDRVTGRTERRGYLQELERQKNNMLGHMRQLEKMLENNGIEVQPYGTHYPPGVAVDMMGNTINSATSKEKWTRMGSVWVKNYRPKSPAAYPTGYSRSTVLESRPVDSHLGVFSDSAPLSSMKGTQLSVLGTTIDITHFDAPDMDNDPPGTQSHPGLYNKSLRSFLRSITKTNPPLESVELPSRSDAFQYSEWYFLMVFPFVPCLHKPSYMSLLTRIYDDTSFKPTTSELVIVHMVFASIYFQYGVRNREEADRQSHLNDLSDKHYHWSLSKFYEVATDSTVTSVQALVLIATHTRSFPKPGCSSLIVGFTVDKAVELGLHRAVKVPGGGTNLENEIRRRTWWSALSLIVTVSGRLGKPIPITVEEYDTDFPVAVPDEYLTEDGITDPSKVGHCHFLVGLVGFRITPLYMEMYSNLYSVRRDSRRYMDVVLGLEEQHRRWEESLPDELQVDKCKPGSQIFALYTQAFSLEFRLCLRHPSVCMTTDAKFCAENTQICEETASKLLKVVQMLQVLKSLDTTWYQMSVYCAAMFSTLVAHWERRSETTATDIASLKEEMASWLSIITEIGLLVGTSSGTHISNEVDRIVTRTVTLIEHDMQRKPGQSSPPAQERAEPSQRQAAPAIKQDVLSQQPSTQSPSTAAPTNGNGSIARSGSTNGNYYGSGMAAQAISYPHLAYPDQTAVGSPTGNGIGYDPNDGSAYFYATAVQHPVDPAAGQTGNPLVAFASQATQAMSGQGDSSFMAAGNPWHDWNAAMADSQERYSANALLTLGSTNQRDVSQGQGSGDTAAGDLAVGMATAHQGQWPLLLFNGGPGTVSGA